MFHVEHFVKFIILTLLGLILCACEKPDPTPELRDPIYRDVESRLKELTAIVESEKKAVAEAEAEVKKAVPQTGQIKFATKHLFDAKKRLEKAEQLKRYYEVRLEGRKWEARQSYAQYYNQKMADKWPPREELAEYQAQEANRTKKREWSVKSRIEQELGTTGSSPPKSGP